MSLTIEDYKNGTTINTFFLEKGKKFIFIRVFVSDLVSFLECFSIKIRELGITLIEMKLSDEEAGKKVVVYGKLGNQDYAPAQIEETLKEIKDGNGNKIIGNIKVEIQKDYFIKTDGYPVISKHAPERGKQGVVISNSVYTGLVNEMIYVANVNVGPGIAQTAYVAGIRLGEDAVRLSKFNNESIDNIIRNLVLAYGYAEIGEIKKFQHKSNTVGYCIKIKDSFFRFDKGYNDRIENHDEVELHVRDQANLILGRRNCFFDRDLLLGIFQAVEFPDKDYKDVTKLSSIISDLDSFEFKLSYNNLSMFENPNDFSDLKSKDPKFNEQLINFYLNRKKRFNLPCPDIKLEDTCSVIVINNKEINNGKDYCEFWVLRKDFLYDINKYEEELYSF